MLLSEFANPLYERALSGFTALDLDASRSRVATATEFGGYLGNIDAAGQAAHADPPTLVVGVKDGRSMRAFGSNQEVDHSLGFGRVGSTPFEGVLCQFGPDQPTGILDVA